MGNPQHLAEEPGTAAHPENLLFTGFFLPPEAASRTSSGHAKLSLQNTHRICGGIRAFRVSGCVSWFPDGATAKLVLCCRPEIFHPDRISENRSPLSRSAKPVSVFSASAWCPGIQPCGLRVPDRGWLMNGTAQRLSIHRWGVIRSLDHTSGRFFWEHFNFKSSPDFSQKIRFRLK